MSRLSQAWLVLSLSAVAVVPAHAQVTVDVSKITCEQYILFTVADPHDIAVWLSGYYKVEAPGRLTRRERSSGGFDRAPRFVHGEQMRTRRDLVSSINRMPRPPNPA
jgi:hypothetical protein